MIGGEPIREYSLALSSPGPRSTHVVGRLSLNAALLPGLPETARRFDDLQGLISARLAEAAGGEELPLDFPVFPAHIDKVHALGNDPANLKITINLQSMTGMIPGGRMGEVREICGAVASHMIEGPAVFPPSAPAEPQAAPVPYWQKGVLPPGAVAPAPLFQHPE